MSQPAQGQDLKNNFLRAEAQVNDSRLQVPENLKMKLYGLSKQIKEGDCKMPQPPVSNAVLRSKWDAWTSCAGMSIEKCMQEYISIVDSLEPHSRNAPRKAVAGDLSANELRKQGTLFKQRDLFKGWRPRHFVLQDNMLQYYLDADDPVARNALDLTGCSISTTKSVFVDGVEYFPFVITHPKSKTPYHLSSDSKLDADMWVAKLIEAANLPAPSQPQVVSSSSEVESSKRPAFDSVNETQQDFFFPNTAHGPETRMYIPPEHLPRVEKSVQALLDRLSETDGWDVLFEKNGLVAKKQPGAVMRVKADLLLPYNVFDVFATLIDPKRLTQLDPQRAEQAQIKEFSNHTWVDYIRFKPVWPTSARDMVNITHWRLLNDGRVVIVGFSEKFDFKPPVEGCVRADAILGGFLLIPSAEGTRVQYLVETDLKGSLPASVVNIAANSQPMMLATLRKIMDQDAKNGGNKKPRDTAADYGELVSFVSNCSYEAHNGPIDASSKRSSVSGRDNSSSSVSIDKSGAAVPIQRKATLLKLLSRTPRMNTTALMMLFFPLLLYYAVDSKWRAVAFIAGLLFTGRYLFKKHLGKPLVKMPTTQIQRQLPGGKFLFRFPVELGRLLVALNEKRTESELEVTITHMVTKACAMVLNEIPSLNGHLVLGNFYRARTPGVEMSVSIALNDLQSVAVKVADASAKPVEFIANELIEASKAIRSSVNEDEPNAVMAKLSKVMPALLFAQFKSLLFWLSSDYGVSVPLLGVTGFPLGVCSVIAASTEGETDLDLAIVSDSRDACAPITVTIGGLRVSPNLDSDRKLNGSPVLNMAVAIDSRAATTSEAKKFCSRLQELINDPAALDKLHAKFVFDREEAAKRKSFFGK